MLKKLVLLIIKGYQKTFSFDHGIIGDLFLTQGFVNLPLLVRSTGTVQLRNTEYLKVVGFFLKGL